MENAGYKNFYNIIFRTGGLYSYGIPISFTAYFQDFIREGLVMMYSNADPEKTSLNDYSQGND